MVYIPETVEKKDELIEHLYERCDHFYDGLIKSRQAQHVAEGRNAILKHENNRLREKLLPKPGKLLWEGLRAESRSGVPWEITIDADTGHAIVDEKKFRDVGEAKRYCERAEPTLCPETGRWYRDNDGYSCRWFSGRTSHIKVIWQHNDVLFEYEGQKYATSLREVMQRARDVEAARFA